MSEAKMKRSGSRLLALVVVVALILPMMAMSAYADVYADTYKVTFNANGGKGAPKAQTVNRDSNITIPGKKPIQAGYTFGGWSPAQSGASPVYKPGDAYTVSADVTLYAKWKLKKGYVEIKFSANGGSKVTAKAVKKGKKAGKLTASKQSMYKFAGWYTKKSGGKKYTSKTKIKKKVTLYAHWKATEAAKVVAIVNEERKKRGVASLKASEELTAAAKVRAKEITVLFDHTRPDGTPCFSASELMRGENIAYGTWKVSAKQVMEMWMDSPGHKENILRPQFETIGVAVYYKDGSAYWVQCFG
ncbi:MAG: InlB B-repeat-containing protein [Clostridiales Family XIII bacterium]|jgi:uncharacterized repeat protein (TIGR02543 family)|nr:InlB B-repeat-containing protein [Clostridiales Family XIII bacterium]